MLLNSSIKSITNKLNSAAGSLEPARDSQITGYEYVNGTSAAVVVSDSIELLGDFDANIMTPPNNMLYRLSDY